MVKDFRSFQKRIYDAVHGFIRFDDYERKLIDSKPFQRLRYISQLGVSYLVFPGATNKRFEHSIGVMEVATRIYHRICKNVRPDVFHLIPRKGSAEYVYWKKVLRMAALCHDLGHLPFSHVGEKDLLGKEGHESYTLKIIQSPLLEEIWDEMQSRPEILKGLERNFQEDVAKISIGEEKLKQLVDKPISYTSWEKILSQIITGDFFGADRIDYLLRDSKSTGIVYGFFDYQQLIEMLRILPSPSDEKDQLELGIDEKGLEACEALLLARYFMHKRVYHNATTKAYNFHLRRFMRYLYEKHPELLQIENYLNTKDTDILKELEKAANDFNDPSNLDATTVLFRKDHFKAILLPDQVSEKDLREFQHTNGISPDKIEWEFSNKKEAKNFTFPVARRHLIIQQAKDCSSLLASLPISKNNWLYISPEYEILFLETLKEKILPIW